MIYRKDEYLIVKGEITDNGMEIELNGKDYSIRYPEGVWSPLEDEIKRSLLDHVSFLATNYLPLVFNKRGIIYNTRVPMMDSFSFKSMIYDLPSSAFLDGEKTLDYLRNYYNLDFVFSSEEPIVWSKKFKPEKAALVSFTSGKDSLLTFALCRRLGIEPIPINIVEPSNTYERKHKQMILQELQRKFGVNYHIVRHDVGVFHDAKRMGYNETSLGWGNQLMYYMFIHLPFILHYRTKYLFFGNELDCDKEIPNHEGFRANFCYDQSSFWTTQMDIMLRLMTAGSARVGSLVGPLNEIAIVKCLYEGFPELAKYQMSCFCEDPSTKNHRWCCNCSKCARNFAFLKALNIDVKEVGFWQDMFQEKLLNNFSVFNGDDTTGFDRSGLGRDEQEFSLFLAAKYNPENKALLEFSRNSKFNDEETLKKAYEYYFGIHEYSAIPLELKKQVYDILSQILWITQEVKQ
ncbi:MAG TPA: hypothetical protein ENN36_07270 [Candidatus Bathyarchaeota archaeon]|nr:hypothetical protein [Candidatus Bathyarchaeota archaeon]